MEKLNVAVAKIKGFSALMLIARSTVKTRITDGAGGPTKNYCKHSRNTVRPSTICLSLFRISGQL